MDIGLYWIGVVVLFLFSALFSASETALFSLSRPALQSIRKKNVRRANLISGFLANPNATVNLIITGNVLVNIALSVVWTVLFIRRWGEGAVIWAVASLTVLLLIFGELLPKTIAVKMPKQSVYVLAPVLNVIAFGLHPISSAFEKALQWIFLRFGIKTDKMHSSFTEEELDALLSIGEKEGAIAEFERDMIEEAMDFDERSVDEIMTPRVDITAVEILSSYGEVLKTIEKSRHTRLPVFKGSIDYILGYVKAKDILLNNNGGDWRGFLRKAWLIPTTKKISDLLKDFKENDIDVAVVVDEYGGTAGLVTLENIVEEILGNIQDEFDNEPKELIRRSDGAIVVSGRMSLRDLEDVIDEEIEIEDADIDTVAGLVLHRIGHMPNGKEKFIVGNWLWEVSLVKDNRIEQVVLKKR